MSNDNKCKEKYCGFSLSILTSWHTPFEVRTSFEGVPRTTVVLHLVKPSKTCCFCGKNHPTEKCFRLSGSIQVKKEKLKSAGLCFRCLLPGHIARGCSVVCRKCNGRHHEIICGPPAVGPTSAGVSNVSSQPPPPPSSGNENASAATHSSSTTSFVSVLHHLVTCPRHTRPLRCSLLVSQCMAVRVLPRPGNV